MKITKSFILTPDKDSNLITEAFGIDNNFNLKICDIEIPDESKWDILYITGESGSGKTTILKEFCPSYTLSSIPNIPLYKWNGESEDEQIKCIEILTKCGISDATMFISTFNQLSDSQQARARIALEIINHKSLIVIDEFLSTLDRNTAKAVAFSIQKLLRKENIKAIFVTAHNDLTDYLKPDYIIEGYSFPSKFTIKKNNWNSINPFMNQISFHYGNKIEYRNLSLAELHYKGKYTGGTKEYLFVNYLNKTIGCLVSTYRMNDGGRRISRVVIHPSYRGCGIGVALVKKYLKDYSNVDVIAAMALFNPIFEKAGMIRVKDSIINPPSGLVKTLKKLNFNFNLWHSKDYCIQFSQNLNVREAIKQYAKNAMLLVQPAGEKLTIEKIQQKIQQESFTCGRVIYGLRKRTMAKFIQK